MNIWRQKTPVISKLRIKGNGIDAAATRLRLERLFGGTDFLSAGLPDRSIVCIKNLRDPAPRSLQLHRVDSRCSDAWRSSVVKEIEILFRRAFRPFREIVPAGAESVVFADDSELLACLAGDWCQGLLPEHWWWRGLFPDLRQAQAIARIWIEAAEFAPAAMLLLSGKGEVIKFVTGLQPDETKNLLLRITIVFGLDELQAALFEPFEKQSDSGVSLTKNSVETPSAPAESHLYDEARKFAPWRESVPETQNPVLSFDEQCLLGIGLTLARAPRIARAAEFARQAKLFRAEFEFEKRMMPDESQMPERKRAMKKRPGKLREIFSLPERSGTQTVLHKSKAEAENLIEKKASERLKGSPDATIQDAEPAGSSSEPESEISAAAAEKGKRSAGKIVFGEHQSEKIPERIESEKEIISGHAREQIIRPPVFAEEPEEFETKFIVETHFGGVFYLLNLSLYLNLYRDFSSSAAETEIALNIWDFVAFLGLELSGEKIKKDAVWRLLQRLAGRENDEDLKGGFAPPGDWRMPSDWLEPFRTNEKWLWKSGGGRLVVRHPDGFNVIDIKSAGDATGRLENELKIYGKDFSQIAEGGGQGFSELSVPPENWLRNLSEYARRRLAQALNLRTREQREISALLIKRKATAAISATNLDVTFSLADLPFEIRLSGLDRDPGWIPAAGKFIRFHFI